MELGESLEDYLESILVLSEKIDHVRSVDVASYLGLEAEAEGESHFPEGALYEDLRSEVIAVYYRPAGFVFSDEHVVIVWEEILTWHKYSCYCRIYEE